MGGGGGIGIRFSAEPKDSRLQQSVYSTQSFVQYDLEADHAYPAVYRV
jgi:hypothetical protein